MLSEKDKAVVLSMIRTGMSIEVLKKSFPQFDEGDIEKLFEEEKLAICDEEMEAITISCNCS